MVEENKLIENQEAEKFLESLFATLRATELFMEQNNKLLELINKRLEAIELVLADETSLGKA